jgi:hypothetical protein
MKLYCSRGEDEHTFDKCQLVADIPAKRTLIRGMHKGDGWDFGDDDAMVVLRFLQDTYPHYFVTMTPKEWLEVSGEVYMRLNQSELPQPWRYKEAYELEMRMIGDLAKMFRFAEEIGHRTLFQKVVKDQQERAAVFRRIAAIALATAHLILKPDHEKVHT